jgi:hypothetical protein
MTNQWVWSRMMTKTIQYFSGSRNHLFGINVFPTEAAPDDRRRAAARALAATEAAVAIMDAKATAKRKSSSGDKTIVAATAATTTTTTTTTSESKDEHKTMTIESSATMSLTSSINIDGSPASSSILSSSSPSSSVSLTNMFPTDAATTALLSDRYSSSESVAALTTTLESHSVQIGLINIGQERDIAEHRTKMDLLAAALMTSRTLPPEIVSSSAGPSNIHDGGVTVPTDHNGSPLTWSGSGTRGEYPPTILFGVSRGAATTFNALCSHQYSNVRLVILEGIFDSIPNLLPLRYPRTYGIALSGLERLTSFRRDGASPISLVSRCPPHIPLVFITSKLDTEVPSTSTRCMVDALMKRAQNPIYLLTLQHSSHAGYALEHGADRTQYATLLHAIYRRYGLPFIPRLADAGKALLLSSMLCDVPSNSLPPSHLRRHPSE